VLTYRGKARVPYLYRSRREGDRVIREFVASGPAALALAADLERLRAAKAVLEHQLRERQRRRRRRQDAEVAVRALRDELEALDRLTEAAFGAIEATFRAALRAASFHQHKRQWCLRRSTMTIKQAGVPATQGRGAAPAAAAARDDQAARERAVERHLTELWRRIAAVDRAAVDALRGLYDRDPGLLAEACGAADFGLGALAGRLADLHGGEDTAGSLLVKWDLDRQVEALAGPDADPLVRLLARRASLCLLHAATVEGRVASQVDQAGENPRLLETLDRASDKADRRLTRAMRTLATAKRLLGRPEPVRVELAAAARVEAAVDVAVSGRVDVELALQRDDQAEQAEGDALAGLLAERAGLGGPGVPADRN
jgi:hypothetical protein